MKLTPLFLVSAAAVGMETALTRFFALAGWSDYGYWVISIVMAGFALSGVVLALRQEFFTRHAGSWLAALPALLCLSAALGYAGVIANPFNPLALQNPDTFAPQLRNIAFYYAALLPFFFLTGLFVSLCFSAASQRLGAVYAADLLGAGAGTLLVLGLMFCVSPFALFSLLLPLLAVAALFTGAGRRRAGWAAGGALVAAELLLALGPQPSISQYKPIFAPAHTPGAKMLVELHRPGGDYMLMDDFTERVNDDISNDSAMLGLRSPPRSFGLYRDGIRIASLPRPGAVDSSYAKGALDALPYAMRPGARTLLLGAGGGFRAAELVALGAGKVDVLEPDPVLASAFTHGLGPSPAQTLPGVRLLRENPRAATAARGQYGMIDLSGDFLDEAPANIYALSAEAMDEDLSALRPGGILSVPVSIQDFPAYALRLLSTLRAAYALRGIDDPAPYVILYRSAWNARILASPTPFTAADKALAAKWADDRSFDISFYAGFDPVAARDNLYNDLPAISFADGTVNQSGNDDSIADEAAAVLAGQSSASSSAFDLRPVTDDRPAFYAILRLDQLRLLLARLQILPQGEIGALVNLAVLGQAALIALFVLLSPLAAPRRAARGIARPAVYFAALALGFLFIELYAIERVSLVLDDRAAGFALVLATMLIFSGAGSFFAGRRAGARLAGGAALAVMLWCALLLGLGTPGALALAGLPAPLAAGACVLVLAPVSFAMGLPFPLGLEALRQRAFLLPWAWGLNGAFSVVATPLANLLLRNIGLHAVLGGAVLLYGLTAISFPGLEGQRFWFPFLRRSAVAD